MCQSRKFEPKCVQSGDSYIYYMSLQQIKDLGPFWLGYIMMLGHPQMSAHLSNFKGSEILGWQIQLKGNRKVIGRFSGYTTALIRSQRKNPYRTSPFCSPLKLKFWVPYQLTKKWSPGLIHGTLRTYCGYRHLVNGKCPTSLWIFIPHVICCNMVWF